MSNVDITKTPFSKYGSYVSVTAEEDKLPLTIHNVRQRFGADRLLTLTFLKNDEPVAYTLHATPYVINVQSSEGSARIYLRTDQGVVIASAGLDFTLEMLTGWSYGAQDADRRHKMISVPSQVYVTCDIPQGSFVGAGPYEPSPGGNPINRQLKLRIRCENATALAFLTIAHYERKAEVIAIDVDAEIAAVRAEWEDFLSKIPPVPAERRPAAEIASFTLWSCFVRAEDCYTYDAMLMSKKTMCSVWSWDHCFNALAMAPVNFQTALEQFLLPFELQDETGALPDMCNPHLGLVWGVVKPPIHGWCFDKLMQVQQIDAPMLRKVYAHLVKWTNWWMDYRDSDGDGLPDYPQGCDSGWDNSTLFDIGFFLESPDLPAFLVLQMRTLAKIARKLDDDAAAVQWEARAAKLLTDLYAHSWNGERFVAKISRTHEYADEQTSLLAVMPIALGDALDPEKFDKLVAILTRDFLTENGPATENPRSPRYQPNGYWRGPIWAPSTYLLVDGLRRGGREDLARAIARNFCDMIQYKAGGNYENFDALTGKGLCAPGYTWTASVNMLLMQEYLLDPVAVGSIAQQTSNGR